MHFLRQWLCFLLFLPIIASCSKEREEPLKKVIPQFVSQPPKDNLKTKAVDTNLYKSYKLTGAQSLSDLSQELGEKRMFILLKINRRDLKHLKEGETYAIPNSDDSENTYSPYPLHVSALDSIHKIIIVSRRVQAFVAYENGKLIKWGPTSTGKKSTPTPEGLYHTNWKSKETHSTVDDAWLLKWYFNLDNLEGISMHEYDLPGYPVSHSCIRLLSQDAEGIYNWAEQWKLSPDRKTIAENGTPVIVFGEYAYGKTPPWKKLLSDVHAADISETEMNEVIKKYMSQK